VAYLNGHCHKYSQKINPFFSSVSSHKADYQIIIFQTLPALFTQLHFYNFFYNFI